MIKLILIFLLCPCYSFAQSLQVEHKPGRQEPPDKKWFYCQNDNSCILTKGVCGGDEALNKKYLTDWKEYLSKQPCRNVRLRHIGATTACSNNECVLVIPKTNETKQ